ncbi:hypothetical protein ACFYTS_23695 [Nocardia sp. NPDC004151]|uniref:hypothetical protein n=1 Tax=unclassified Nocardia TaxID=2637762 RepID=UPI003648B6D1
MAWEVAVSAQGPDGLSVGEMRQLAITEKLQELRDEMCDADTGAWLSARFIVNRGRQREIIFNYDENPNWLPELHPLMWLRDLEAYPRAEQHVPQWLREMVALGLDLEHRHEPGEPA